MPREWGSWSDCMLHHTHRESSKCCQLVKSHDRSCCRLAAEPTTRLGTRSTVAWADAPSKRRTRTRSGTFDRCRIRAEAKAASLALRAGQVAMAAGETDSNYSSPCTRGRIWTTRRSCTMRRCWWQPRSSATRCPCQCKVPGEVEAAAEPVAAMEPRTCSQYTRRRRSSRHSTTYMSPLPRCR